jgi:hypothetical protein
MSTEPKEWTKKKPHCLQNDILEPVSRTRRQHNTSEHDLPSPVVTDLLNLFPNVWSEKSEILIRYHKAELHLITGFYTEADGVVVN